MHPIVEKLANGLIVSCQSRPEDGLVYGSQAMAAMANAAELGGAVGIRANGGPDITAIRRTVKLPIIGIYKQHFEELGIRITPSLEAAREVVEAGADVVALDATVRGAAEGRLPVAELIQLVKQTFGVPVMADISTLDEGIAAAEAGADLVATTLSGYTVYSPSLKIPDYELVRQLAARISAPVVAEGRISTPGEARRVFELGAYAVVVGTMITRPRWLVDRYVKVLKAYHDAQHASILIVEVGSPRAWVFDGRMAQPDTIDVASAVESAADPKSVGMTIRESLKAHPACVAIGVLIGSDVTVAQPDALYKALHEEFARPMEVVSRTRAVVLAEALYGAGRQAKNVLGVVLGMDISGAIVGKGDAITDFGLTLGHAKVAPEGRICTCGARGCLEAYVSDQALLDDYNGRQADAKRANAVEHIWHAAQQGDPDARAAIQTMGGWLGRGLAPLLDMFRPDLLVIGGSVQADPEFLNVVRQAAQRDSLPSVRDTPIVLARLGPKGKLLGASMLVRRMLDADEPTLIPHSS